ncbi:unnamed protein product [Arctogadus glacialis]
MLIRGETVAEGGLVRNRNSTTDENASRPPNPIDQRKSPKLENAVTIAVSPELFHMEEEQQIYENQGMENYFRFHRERMTEHWSPGPAFSFVKAMEAVNVRLRELYPDSEELFDVVLMTSNHHQLPTDTKLYLSADETKVREVLENGIAAATMFAPERMTEVSETELRVAFDGDAVLFSDESERFFKANGLDMFEEREQGLANLPMDTGPLTGFLEALVKLQKKFYAKDQRMDCPIRTYLVTARSGGAGTRALNTLRGWGLDTDGAHFLAGAKKGPFLELIQPHIFFDDQKRHVDSALELGLVACHVPIA